MLPAPESGPGPAGPLVRLADRCVQCGLCLPHCPTYALDGNEAESPRGRIAYVRAVASAALAPTEAGDRHLDHCLGCRRCESACPAGVEYGALLLAARAAQYPRRRPRFLSHCRLWLLARPRLLRRILRLVRPFSAWLPAAWRLPSPPPAADPAPMPPRGDVDLFVGCIALDQEGTTRQALQALVERSGQRLGIPAGQGCCGTAAAHAGDAVQASALAERNRRSFAASQRVLSLASGCHEGLARGLAASTPVEDALSFLDRQGTALRFRSALGRRVAWHVPCSQSGSPGVGATRRLLARVPDLEVVELPDAGCCGAAGTHMLEFPDRAARLRAPLLAAIGATGVDEVLSANIGCRLHLAGGTTLSVRHPIDLLAEYLE